MRIPLLALALLAAPVAQADRTEPYFGHFLEVDVDFMFDLESAVIRDVRPDSPAAKAGLQTGDRITDIEGCAVPGCGLFKAARLMSTQIGEPLQLKLNRVDGTAYSATLIGTASPLHPVP